MTAPSAIRRLNAADADFARHLDHLLSWESVSDEGVNEGCWRSSRLYASAAMRRWSN